jgi:inhibitor of cysteine peptidase
MNKLFFLLTILALALTACGGKSTEAPVPQLQISDPGKNIEVVAGNEFKIIIESNPTTGYHWELIGELDAGIVQFVSKDYRADEPVLIGSGGSDVWIFKAVAAGETTITLGYYPPSNDPVDPNQTVTFTVTVK